MFSVVITPRAAGQLQSAARWWEENRQAVPGAVLDDFEQATVLLSRQPYIGATSESARYPQLRRLYLERIRYHVYYEVRHDRVFVLAFWHASRGSKPAL